MNFPSADLYLNYTEIQLNYTATDIDLQSCELWGDFSGNFSLNQTNLSVVSSQQSSFLLNLSDGSYMWNIKCNDTQGHQAFNGNRTFYIDTILPDLTVSEPSGTKTSLTSIPLTFSVSDASPISCIYNVSFSASGSVAVDNTVIANCTSTIFNVDTFSNYILSLRVNDSAGNTVIKTSSFSVSSSSGGGGTGGGGGGGGSSRSTNIVLNLSGKLETDTLSDMVVRAGDKKTISWHSKNIGLSFLNNCKIISGGEHSSWVFSSEIIKIGGGEEHDFTFDLIIPENIESGIFIIPISLVCSETRSDTSFSVEILKEKLEFSLIEAKRQGDSSVYIKYNLRELSGADQNADIQFLLYNSDNEKVSEFIETRLIIANSNQEFETFIPVESSLIGDFNLLININSETYSTFIQENIVLGAPLSGFAVFFRDSKGLNNIIFAVIIILFFIFIFFMITRIIKLRSHKKKTVDYSLVK